MGNMCGKGDKEPKGIKDLNNRANEAVKKADCEKGHNMDHLKNSLNEHKGSLDKKIEDAKKHELDSARGETDSLKGQLGDLQDKANNASSELK